MRWKKTALLALKNTGSYLAPCLFINHLINKGLRLIAIA